MDLHRRKTDKSWFPDPPGHFVFGAALAFILPTHTRAHETLNYIQTLGISISFRKTSNYELFIIYGFMCGKFSHFPRLPTRIWLFSFRNKFEHKFFERLTPPPVVEMNGMLSSTKDAQPLSFYCLWMCLAFHLTVILSYLFISAILARNKTSQLLPQLPSPLTAHMKSDTCRATTFESELQQNAQ